MKFIEIIFNDLATQLLATQLLATQLLATQLLATQLSFLKIGLVLGLALFLKLIPN